MFEKAQSIITATAIGTMEDMCRSLLSLIDAGNVIKIAFFFRPSNNSEYLHNYALLRKAVKEHFPIDTPLVSYIAQETIAGVLTAEVTTLENCCATVERKGNYILIRQDGCTELVTEGIVPGDISRSTFEQAGDIFATVGAILQENGFAPSDIYRQWNYIQGITVVNDGSQNYQEFNDARSIFYSGHDWSNGYPAATGIGTSAGGVMVEVNAIKGCNAVNMPIDNPLQIAAHNYSQSVLDGRVIEQLKEKTTPKFERARVLGNTILISGTAAIRGELSNGSNDTVKQTAETMDIMDRLVSRENIPADNNGSRYNILRVYVKQSSCLDAVKSFMGQRYPTVPKHYLVADICRPELLVEIEGTASI